MRTRDWFGAALLGLAGCDGGDRPESATSPEAETADVRDGLAETAEPSEPDTSPDREPDRAGGWELPDAFRVVIPKAPGDESLGLPRRIEHRASGIELDFVPPGSFEFGSTDADPGHARDESPAAQVEVSAFFVARTETTLAQWKAGAGEDEALRERGRADGDDHPISEVTWNEVRAWCDANGLDLPSEVQWEYAASGPDDAIFPWGDEPKITIVNARGTNVGDLWDRTAPVGALPAGRSWCGAYDMAGNLSEWCRSPWTADHASEPDETQRIIRGGSYTCRPPYCVRTAYRDALDPEVAAANVGFRVILDVEI